MGECIHSRAKGHKADCVNGLIFAAVEHECNQREHRGHGKHGRAKDCDDVFHGVCCVCVLLVGIDCVKNCLTSKHGISKASDSFGEAVASKHGDVLIHIVSRGSLESKTSGAFKIKFWMPVASLEKFKDLFLGHVAVEFFWSGGGGGVSHGSKLTNFERNARKKIFIFRFLFRASLE